MVEIEIILFSNKHTHVRWSDASGAIVEGEHNVTSIRVTYPQAYSSLRRYAYLVNAKGESARVDFEGLLSQKQFLLPASMTFAGTTKLVFYAESDTEKMVWLPIEIPIAATNVDYKEVARASPDILQEAIKATEELREFLKQQKG